MRRIIPLIPFLLLPLLFPAEVSVFMRWLLWGQSPIPNDAHHAFLVLSATVGAFCILFLIWSVIVSDQVIFPITRLSELAFATLYFIFYFFSLHGMAIYVRNGKIKAWVEELHRTLPGVAIVDFNSAVAVEQIVLRPGLFQRLMLLFRRLVKLCGLDLPAVRIKGAGLLFTLPDERIHGTNDLTSHPVMNDASIWMNEILGVVDLRNQFRISVHQPHPLSKRLGSSVLAYTRDGIEVKTNIWVLATLGHDPVPYFPLNVTYVGDRHPRNLRVVQFKKISERSGLYRVESLSDELDQSDRFEIHEQWQSISEWFPYADAPRHPITPLFNCKRVFAAIYARARHHGGLAGTDEIVPWFDLPVHVAIDLFRETVSHYNYNEIIDGTPNGGMRINEVRGRLGSAMRNSGLLSFRPVFDRSGIALTVGRRYSANSLLTIPPTSAIALQTSKVLRDRGIRIIASGFGDLNVDERIYKQRLDNWRAKWDQETEIMEAGLELESMRVRTRVRIQAQQDFVQGLAQIYQSNGNSKEILALRVLQALEAAATDPQTRQLLPEDTFAMLRNIHDWLLPQDLGPGTGYSGESNAPSN